MPAVRFGLPPSLRGELGGTGKPGTSDVETDVKRRFSGDSGSALLVPLRRGGVPVSGCSDRPAPGGELDASSAAPIPGPGLGGDGASAGIVVVGGIGRSQSETTWANSSMNHTVDTEKMVCIPDSAVTVIRQPELHIDPH